jgi:hypothetical protein
MSKPLTAIVFFEDHLERKPYKYRNIYNLDGFIKFLQTKHPEAIYFNTYDKKTKLLERRIYLR